ncbi:MAG: hypothetical protein QM538_02820 [Methylacidiphilales bacterium]|nr:hypothetical protein [Candidatus Methylacidiphilales bacterium]
MLVIIHLICALIALLCLLLFLGSSVIAELFLSHEQLITVKFAIVNPGLFILIPAMMGIGISGYFLSKKNTSAIVVRKISRMRTMVLLAFVILIPSALVVRYLVGTYQNTIELYFFQTLELVVGGVNIYLLLRNMFDGFILTGRRRNHQLHKEN